MTVTGDYWCRCDGVDRRCFGFLLFLDSFSSAKRTRVATLSQPLKLGLVQVACSNVDCITYLVDAFAMEKVTASDEFASLFALLHVTQADQASLFGD